jgi:hypothetical protein
VALLARLSQAKRRLSLTVDTVADLRADDPVFTGTMRQIRATDVMLATMGGSVHPGASRTAIECWRLLWEGRRHVAAAVRLLRAFEAATGTRALPSSQPRESEAIAALGTTLPAPLRRRPAGGAG